MSAFVTEATLRSVMASAYGAVSNGLGLIAVLLLICLLAAQLLLRALGGSRGKRADMLDVAIWPLVLVMLVDAILRILQLVPGA